MTFEVRDVTILIVLVLCGCGCGCVCVYALSEAATAWLPSVVACDMQRGGRHGVRALADLGLVPQLQVIGQQKIVGSGFSTASTLPHTGVLYLCDLVQSAPQALRKKALKVVAAKYVPCRRWRWLVCTGVCVMTVTCELCNRAVLAAEYHWLLEWTWHAHVQTVRLRVLGVCSFARPCAHCARE